MICFVFSSFERISPFLSFLFSSHFKFRVQIRLHISDTLSWRNYYGTIPKLQHCLSVSIVGNLRWLQWTVTIRVANAISFLKFQNKLVEPLSISTKWKHLECSRDISEVFKLLMPQERIIHGKLKWKTIDQIRSIFLFTGNKCNIKIQSSRTWISNLFVRLYRQPVQIISKLISIEMKHETQNANALCLFIVNNIFIPLVPAEHSALT